MAGSMLQVVRPVGFTLHHRGSITLCQRNGCFHSYVLLKEQIEVFLQSVSSPRNSHEGDAVIAELP